MAARWIDELNPEQLSAAAHPSGPVLVIAGAGTGKTKTLAGRVAWLVEQGVAPDRILLLTFTRRAAAEMIERAARLTGKGTTSQVWGGTFHAVANRLLRQYGRSLGLVPDFTVIDQGDAADLMNLVRMELGLGESRRRFPKKNTLVSIYSRAVNSRTKLGEVVERHFPWVKPELDGIRQIFEAYTRRKRAQQVLDYDDLLLYWHALLQQPGTADIVADQFEHILVDEYQDTNLIQAEILQGMRRNRKEIMVVGDDAQSIYSFRAANVRNILDFPQQFPGATVIKLEQNYRSMQPILDASNAVMAQAKERYTKNLFSDRGGHRKPAIITCRDEPEQCSEVCDRVLAFYEEGTALREQAVLFRAGHHSDQLEVELNRRNIPFVKYGGLKFVEAAHVKDLVAILRILDNPSDELSWHRVLQLLEGIGPVTARRLIDQLLGRDTAPSAPEPEGQAESETPANPLQRLLHGPLSFPPAAKEDIAALRSAIADCLGLNPKKDGAGVELSPAAQVERIRRFYEPIFERAYDNPEVRLRDLDQLEQIAAGYQTRGQFITDLTLDPPQSTQDLAGPPLLDEDYLILSTVHSAKGSEWDVVHIIHVADGMIPSDMSTGNEAEIEEERRLLYVAMTRARNILNLYFPLRYYHNPHARGDRHSYAQLTRFIPPSIADRFERVGAHTAQPVEGPAAEAPGAGAATVDSLLNSLWND